MSHPSDQSTPHPELFENFLKLFNSLNRRERLAVTKKVTEEAKPTVQLYILMILAAVIVTLGLLLNSESIVIGGMLIAPFLPMLNAIPVAAVRGSIRLFHRSSSTLVMTALLSLVTAYAVSSIVPLSHYTEAVISRTEPNILYLIVALTAGLVSGFALIWPSVNSLIAGVAVATALMPPLCVSGIGIANLDWTVFTQALILFGANLVAIIFSSIIVLLAVGFRPYHRAKSVELLWKNIIWSVILLLLITIPLAAALNHTAKREETQQKIKQVIYRSLPEVEEVSNISITKYDKLTQIEIQLLSSREPDEAEWEQLKRSLREVVDADVSLVLNTVLLSHRTE